MRALTPATLAAVGAIVTSPGHLVYLGSTPPLYWSDVGQVNFGGGLIYAAVDMSVRGIKFDADGKPGGLSVTVGNLDSSVGALLLANDLTAFPVYVSGIDTAAANVADAVAFGQFNVAGANIGIGEVTLTLTPPFFTAPFRRVDAANGFNHATPAGTEITWGQERTTFFQEGPMYDAMGRRRFF